VDGSIEGGKMAETKRKTAGALAGVAVVAAAGMTSAPVSAASALTNAAKPRGFVPGPRPAARAIPDTYSRCKSDNGVRLCGYIWGHSGYVSEMAISIAVTGAGIWFHGELRSPKSFSWNTSRSYYRSDGNYVFSPLGPESTDVRSGPWDFIVWRKNSNGTYTNIDHLDVSVVG
jgi:hypothetical protein